tara:strand:+ start:152 stop:550 length:399 start_codon:yes stop_codon:yes gene_type:complete
MKVLTLIDISETKQRRNNSKDSIAIGQQANWMTFIQTMMLRTNIACSTPKIVDYTATQFKDLGFGTAYTGKHKVWEVESTTDEYQYFPPVEALEEDFDLVPVISGLNETIKINNNVFRTTHEARNIIFKADD